MFCRSICGPVTPETVRSNCVGLSSLHLTALTCPALPGRAAVRCVLLVSTDGVHDMVNNDHAVDVAFKHWGDPAGAAKELVAEAGEGT